MIFVLHFVIFFLITKFLINTGKLIFIIYVIMSLIICHLIIVFILPEFFISSLFVSIFINIYKRFIVLEVKKNSSIYIFIILVLFLVYQIIMLGLLFIYLKPIFLQKVIIFLF